MWNCVWCLVLVSLPAWVYAGIAEELAEATQLCCSQGTRYARNHTSEDCSSSVPPDVSPAYGALCIFAMDQCCKEYFQKKDNCEDGAEIANKGSCDSTSGFTKTCCTECSRGKAAGSKLGDSACTSNPRGTSPEELLAGDTYESCCKKAAEEPPDDHNEEPVTTSKKSLLSVLPSLCEDYAPNELCAHHCIPIPGSYKCECNPGFKLMADRRNCIEVVKNRCKPHNPCQHKCNDNGLQIKCSCRRGYELLPDGKSCKDIDECILDPPVCLPGTQCHNIQGSYRCILTKKNNPEVGQCPPGFTKNIMNNACDDINECKLPRPPCPSYLCENTVGGYKCGGVPGDPVNLASSMKPPTEDRCPSGFRVGYNEECEDVDECAMNKDDCNHLSQFCINTRGEFYCQDKVSKHCPPGFKIDPVTNKCEDINECEDGDEICRPDQICINQLGQYDCKLKSSFRKDRNCPDGMRLTPGTSVCEDIDECVEGTHLCDQYQNCLNTNGSHECTCKIGFEQDITTGACVDVNECATDQHSCILETQRCDNTIGSFLCIRFTSCGTGYILQHSTGKCEDIDECALGTHNCARAGPEYHCVNIPGSFRCIRKRSTTTSTTPLPEYEYYYDSEEEIDGNETSPQTGNQPEYTSSTTTTPKLETSSETPRTVPATKPTEPPHPTNEFPTISKTPDKNEDKRIHEVDERTNEVVPPSTDIPETSIINFKSEQPQPVVPPEIEEAPTTPKMEFKQQPTEPKLTPISPKPDKPDYYEPRSTESNYLESPSINESTPPDTNELMQPETTYSLISSTLPTVLNQPSLVYVEVGKETATVKAHKEDDGSLVINTKDVPKNEWTKVNEKPTNCQFGFELDEYGACYDIDECVTNRHKCSGLTEICKNTMGGYLCECAPGFRRDLYTGACDLVVSSTSTTTSTTVPPPTTTPRHYFWGYPEFRPQTVRPFRPRNLCDAGFHLDSRTGQCEDVNECINGQANCAEVEICVNTEGGYRCECPPNWHIDNFKQRCVPNRTNEQFPTGYGNQPEYPSIHGSIIPNFPQGEIKGTDYVDPEITPIENRGTIIRCPWGYRLGDDSTCVDIDECSTGDANCGPLQICMNLPGGYTCSCPSGHRLIGDHECEDVDECMLAGRNPICSQNADCINTIGSYQCRCHEGFRSAPINDKVCVDVDECTENRAGSLCEQRCNNVWGSYRCSCHRGYRINADNSTCADIDECTEFKSKFLCVGKCYNQPGSYRCDCPSGYRLSEDKRSCIDIDECETGIAPCAGAWTGSGSSDVCLNTRGGYRCHRINCPPGYQLESKHRCTKVERVCPPADWECAHQPSTYSYNFITFVSNLFIPDSKVDLFTMRGPTWAHAQIKFQLRLLDVNAPPTVKNKADINSFLLSQSGNQGVVSLVRSLEGPQSIELELMMELYNRGQFGGIAVAKLFIFISEYEF